MNLDCNQWGRHALGVFFVMLVVFLWVSSSELTQSIFENKSYDHPFFLTYYNTSLFMIYAPFFMKLYMNQCKMYCNRNSNENPQLYSTLAIKEESSSSNSYQSLDETDNMHELDHNDAAINNNDSQSKDVTASNDSNIIATKTKNTKIRCGSVCVSSLDSKKLSLYSTAKMAMIFCPIWFLMNYTFNVSLNKTSVASNTILSSMSGPFSLILSRLFLRSPISLLNFAGVTITLCGAVFIGYLDQKQSSGSSSHETLWGDILALISALIYGLYVTLIKYFMKDETRINMFLFFAIMGTINVMTLWPLIFIFNATGYETFAVPSNDVLFLLTLNGLISVGSDYFWAQSILLTSPVVATVGLSMMMPIAMIADEIFRHDTHSVLYWCSSIFVMVGFILVNLDFKEQHEIEEQETDKKH